MANQSISVLHKRYHKLRVENKNLKAEVEKLSRQVSKLRLEDDPSLDWPEFWSTHPEILERQSYNG